MSSIKLELYVCAYDCSIDTKNSNPRRKKINGFIIPHQVNTMTKGELVKQKAR